MNTRMSWRFMGLGSSCKLSNILSGICVWAGECRMGACSTMCRAAMAQMGNSQAAGSQSLICPQPCLCCLTLFSASSTIGTASCDSSTHQAALEAACHDWKIDNIDGESTNYKAPPTQLLTCRYVSSCTGSCDTKCMKPATICSKE